MGEKKKMVDINKELQHLKQEVSDMKQLNKEIYGVTGFILLLLRFVFHLYMLFQLVFALV